MRLFIPTIGTRIKLLEPWTFTLKAEERNTAFAFKMGQPWLDKHKQLIANSAFAYSLSSTENKIITLPAGSILVVDRIYIRSNLKEYDSITFRYKSDKVNGRFFAVLTEVNNIEFELI